jgi:lysine/ornithine N-monooxygenase
MCEALETIVKSCDNNSGGIEKIWINQQDNIASIDLDDTNTWTIDAITLAVGAPDYTPFEIRRNTGSYVEDAAIDLVNGSSYVTATITLMFHRRDQDKSQSIKILGAGQQYLNAIVKDMNGKYWYFPYLQLSAVGEGSGTTRADGSKYSVTLIAENDFLAYEIEAAAVNAVIA